MYEVKVIADLEDACGEGPIWDPLSSTLRWVDITGERLHTLEWPNGTVRTERPGVPVSGLALTNSNALLLAGGDGIWLWSGDGPLVRVAREHRGERLGINDCIADESGRLLVGTTFFDGTATFLPGSLYAVDLDGSVRTLETGFGLANGMGFSVDGRTFYLTDSFARRIYSYDYDSLTGDVSERRLFVQVPPDEGLPDGLTVDADDYVWSAQWFGSCVCRYDPEGSLERRIALPAKQVSSLTFGRPELTEIFVTSAAFSDALMLAPPGYEPTGKIGGQLFHVNAGIPGKLEFRCQFTNIASGKESTLANAPFSATHRTGN